MDTPAATSAFDKVRQDDQPSLGAGTVLSMVIIPLTLLNLGRTRLCLPYAPESILIVFPVSRLAAHLDPF